MTTRVTMYVIWGTIQWLPLLTFFLSSFSSLAMAQVEIMRGITGSAAE